MSWSVPGPLSFITTRYGVEVLGGAETSVRQIAERLAARGLPVEVLTTCAVDHFTWDNHYTPGREEVNGVVVERFPTVRTTKGALHKVIGEKIVTGVRTSLHEQEQWLNDGWRCPQLYHHLSQNHDRYHTLVLTPYMFWTTYACAQIAPAKNILRPCLHDESFAYLDIYKSMFRDARGIWFNAEPEADLARKIFDLPANQSVLGEGVEVPDAADPDRFRAVTGIEGPFLLYAGRREWGKNVDMLIEHFGRYTERHPENLKLVLMGKGEVLVPEKLKGSVIDLGFIDESLKHDALNAATVVCQPSRWESFSKLLMDAWLAEKPVLTFGGCEVTAFHTIKSKGGFVFNDYFDFEAGLEVLLQNPELASQMGRTAKIYVEENYMWDDVIDRIIETIDRWAVESVAVTV